MSTPLQAQSKKSLSQDPIFEIIEKERKRQQEGIESFAVPRAEQRSQLGTDSYFGGVVFTAHCSLHPGRFHRELLRLTLGAGAQVVGTIV